ncbi:MAG: hypothetical protein IKG14_00655 [Clostridia bacterium]|nr:hypothetical protein [Clostridia bacterium]
MQNISYWVEKEKLFDEQCIGGTYEVAIRPATLETVLLLLQQYVNETSKERKNEDIPSLEVYCRIDDLIGKQKTTIWIHAEDWTEYSWEVTAELSMEILESLKEWCKHLPNNMSKSVIAKCVKDAMNIRK